MGMTKKKPSENPVNGRATIAQTLWNPINEYDKKKKKKPLENPINGRAQRHKSAEPY